MDKLAYESKLCGISVNIKASISFVAILLTFIFNSWLIQLLISIFMVLSVCLLGGTSIKKYIILIRIPMAFLLISTLTIMLSISTDKEIFIKSIKMINLYMGISKQGFNQAISSFFRAGACLTSIYFFTLTSPFVQMVILFKKLKLPKDLIEISLLMYRFIFVFIEEIETIRMSQELRFAYMGLKNSYRSLAVLTRSLYERIIQRYEDMKICLDLRLFDGEFYV